MRMRLVCVVMVIAFLALTGEIACSYADGQGGNKSGRDLAGKFCQKVSFIMENEKDLALTEDQVKGIKEIKLKIKKDLIKMDADIDVAEIDVGEALRQDNIDVPAVNALIDKQYDLKKEKAKSLTASFAALKVILTAEQKDKMKELWKTSEKKEGYDSDKCGTMKCPKSSSNKGKM